jgi:hypothetical protein
MRLRLVAAALAAAVMAHAHFVYVTPDPGGATAKVFISENLTPDLDASMIGTTKLNLRGPDGSVTPLTLGKGEKAFFTVALPGGGNRVVYGVTDLGVMQRGQSKPHWLVYYPKTIVGDAFDAKMRLDDSIPVELVPVGRAGSFRLKLLGRGKPQSDSEIMVVLPNGDEKKVKTDANGETETFTQPGRYGAWGRFWETEAGEHNGKKYDEVRHYATLVFDAGEASSAVSAPAANVYATMPEASASFGSAVDADWLYIYGGHTAPTHAYFKGAVSGRFHRMKLTGEPVWQELPGGPALQGMNLAAHHGQIYRVGGMAPQNEKGQAADNRSVADVARFDVKKQVWEPLPPLPQTRSSHDVVVAGNKLIVVGGWALNGKSADEWRSTVEILDLAAKKPEWKSVPQPFQRRALMAAVLDGKVFVIGGMNEKQQVVRDVSIFDPSTETWSEGPKLPEGALLGFAPAAGVHQGELFVSLGDGSLIKMNRAGVWEKAGKQAPRVAHRMASAGSRVLLIGGAVKGKNLDVIEEVRLTAGGERSEQ